MSRTGGWLLLVLVARVLGREVGNFSTVGWSEERGVEHRDVCVEICLCDNQAVNCSWAGLDTVPPNLNPSITGLTLEGNEIAYVGNMEMYSRLENLNLDHNRIVEIRAHCFRLSRNMAELRIRDNQLGTLERADLEGLMSLVVLDMSQNNIDNISERAFWHQENLQTVNLTSNRLPSLHRRTFDGSVRRTLRNLYLAHNLLTKVPREALAGLEDLSILDLSHNMINKVDSGEFSQIGSGLRELRMAGCHLYEVGPFAFQGISYLQLLDLSNNRLKRVPNRAFNNLPMLEKLYFGRNPVSSLSREDFVSLKQLTTFSMDGCEVEDQLELGFNLFTANSDLQVLEFRCPSLSFHPDFSLSHLSQLTELSLHGSSISTLSPSLLDSISSLPQITSLDLSHNPLVCDCHLLPLVDLLRESPELNLHGSCAQPSDLHGQQLDGLFYSSWSGQLECEDGGVNGPVIAGLTLGLLTGLLLLLFACVYWRKKPWVLSIFRRKEKKRLSVGPNFTGNKKDIKVIQREVEPGEHLIPVLSDGLQQQEDEDEEPESENVYETIPPYSIPVNFPDVKVSEL